MVDCFVLSSSSISSFSRAGALQHLDILPIRHLQLRRVVLVEVDDHQLIEFAGRAARLGHPLPVLLPQQALQQSVMVRWVVAGRATTLAIAGVEAFRVHNKLEALQVLEHHRQLMPAALLVVVALAFATPPLVQRHQFLGGGSLSPFAAGLRRGEHVQRRVGDFAPRWPTIVKELQLETVVLQSMLEPIHGHLGGIQLQPSGARRLALWDLVLQQETPGDRRAEIDQRLEIARTSVIALKKESQGRVINRDVLRVAGNRDGEVQGMTVVLAPPAKAEARLVPRMLCNEKYRHADECMSLCKREAVNGSRKIHNESLPLLNRMANLCTTFSEFLQNM